ncbi:MAG TPA: aldehyde dehydrogenase family protein [Acidimicrobiales bacterium]|nr:aldehyde dehydrogenase family protein [Acidimicrobiales bacterium]
MITSVNPATGEERILDVAETTAEEVAAICELARRATREIATRPLLWRASMLRTMADALEESGENIVAAADFETALGRARLEGELRRTSFQLRFFADVVEDTMFLGASIDHATDSPMGPLADMRRLRVPLGAVAVFGSSNFPLAFSVPGGDTASALAAGCAVVVKAHPAHPHTSALCAAALAEGARRVGAPDGTLEVVYGFAAGTALVSDENIAAVGFTGSLAAGQALWRLANERREPIPFYGELGSANPLVVTSAAARARAREIGAGAAASMTLGVGQFCTKPGLLFVPEGADGDALVESLVESLTVSPTFTMLTSAIAAHFREGVSRIGAHHDVVALVAPAPDAGTTVRAQLYGVEARVFASDAARDLREECFGPLAIVVRYAGREDLFDALGAASASLTMSVFAEADDPDAADLVEHGATRAGRVIVNAFPTGVGVSWSMHHGGPWPATTAPLATSVGAAGIERWLRAVTYQSVPGALLPAPLREENPWGVARRVDGVLTAKPA